MGEGGKRPLSSMSPTIVYDASGKPVFALGAAGGKTIIMQVAKALIAHFDWGLSARQAITLPLVFFNSEGLILDEGTWVESLKPALNSLGQQGTYGTQGMKATARDG